MTNSTYIKVCLEDELRFASSLLELLCAEREALSENNASALEKIAGQKRNVAEQLETSAERRSAYLLETIGAASPDLRDYLDAAPASEESRQLTTLWEELAALLNDCREQNRLNGSILESSQRSIKQAIALLQGQGQAGELYGRAGKTVPSASGHSLTRA